MADTLGQFFRQPKLHEDVVDPKHVDPLAVVTPSHPPVLTVQPAPELRSPNPIGPLQPAPAPSVPAQLPDMPAPALTHPATLPDMPPPPLRLTASIPFQPAPPLSVTASIPFQPAPVLSVTGTPGFQDPPPLSVPVTIPFQPAPALTVPASMAFQPPPDLTAPHPVTYGNPSDGDPHDHPGQQHTPAIPTLRHSDQVAGAEAQGNHTPGLIGAAADAFKGAVNDIVGMAGNIDVRNHGAVDLGIPGVPPLPFDTDINTHGGKINVGVDLHFRQSVRQVAAVGKEYVEEKARAAVNQGAQWALDKIGFPAKMSPQAPLSSDAPLAPQKEAVMSGPPQDPTVLPTVEVPPSNGLVSYNVDARNRAQTAQQEAARRADLEREGNRYNRLRRIQDLVFGDNNQRAFISPFNVASGSDNKLSAVIPNSNNNPEQRGFFLADNSKKLPDDDEAYVPLVFTDMRSMGGKYRSIYFRPFIKSLSENFAPQWSMNNFFGRVDPVATYQSTNRTINLAFKLVAFDRADLDVLYQKLAWLTSLVYPEYSGADYFRGPVCRLRVGDVINAQSEKGLLGIPGVITSLDVNYDETTWELEKGAKVPRYIDVSVGFQVLHEGPVGVAKIVPGNKNSQTGFGTLGNGINYKQVRFGSAFKEDINVPGTPAGGQRLGPQSVTQNANSAASKVKSKAKAAASKTKPLPRKK